MPSRVILQTKTKTPIASVQAQRNNATDNMQKLLRWVKPMCFYASDRHDDEFENELTRLGLMPIRSALEAWGFTHFIDKLHYVGVQACVIDRSEIISGSKAFVCQSGRVELSDIYKARGVMLGMCLLCLKQGKDTASLDSFSDVGSYNMNLGRVRAVGIYYGPGPAIEPKWSYEHDWRVRKTIRTEEEERILSKAVKNNNCMASTRREHQRNHKHVEQWSKTRDEELSEQRLWAERLQSMEQSRSGG